MITIKEIYNKRALENRFYVHDDVNDVYLKSWWWTDDIKEATGYKSQQAAERALSRWQASDKKRTHKES